MCFKVLAIAMDTFSFKMVSGRGTDFASIHTSQSMSPFFDFELQ